MATVDDITSESGTCPVEKWSPYYHCSRGSLELTGVTATFEQFVMYLNMCVYVSAQFSEVLSG